MSTINVFGLIIVFVVLLVFSKGRRAALAVGIGGLLLVVILFRGAWSVPRVIVGSHTFDAPLSQAAEGNAEGVMPGRLSP